MNIAQYLTNPSNERHVSPIARLYTHDELTRFFMENPLASAEYDLTFLGFSKLYLTASLVADKALRVYDVGCCLGLQSRFFSDFADYVGVDFPSRVILEGFPPYKRAWELFDNIPGRFVASEGVNFLEKLAADNHGELEQSLILVSAVPDRRVDQTAHRLFPNVFTWYPGEPSRAKGHKHDELVRVFNELSCGEF